MTDIDYEAVLKDTAIKFASTLHQIDALQAEADKMRQFFVATLNMLPDEKKSKYEAEFHAIVVQNRAKDASLKEAVLKILNQAYPKYLTSADVRDQLLAKGFDFSEYASNPLASVSTTLRRFKPEEVETAEVEGVTAYRRPTRKIKIRGRFDRH